MNDKRGGKRHRCTPVKHRNGGLNRMSCLNVDVKAALRLEEDELTNDVFGVWFTFVCCAVNKQSWS